MRIYLQYLQYVPCIKCTYSLKLKQFQSARLEIFIYTHLCFEVYVFFFFILLLVKCCKLSKASVGYRTEQKRKRILSPRIRLYTAILNLAYVHLYIDILLKFTCMYVSIPVLTIYILYIFMKLCAGTV